MSNLTHPTCFRMREPTFIRPVTGFYQYPVYLQCRLKPKQNGLMKTLKKLKLLSKILNFDEVISAYEKTKRRIVVSVDEKKCLGCGVCEEVCNWGAIKIGDIAEIEREKCERCGLCVCSCLQKALWLENLNIVRGIARE